MFPHELHFFKITNKALNNLSKRRPKLLIPLKQLKLNRELNLFSYFEEGYK